MPFFSKLGALMFDQSYIILAIVSLTDILMTQHIDNARKRDYLQGLNYDTIGVWTDEKFTRFTNV